MWSWSIHSKNRNKKVMQVHNLKRGKRRPLADSGGTYDGMKAIEAWCNVDQLKFGSQKFEENWESHPKKKGELGKYIYIYIKYKIIKKRLIKQLNRY